ncbi:haloacid dehalogenase superfamily, subfamily IA, variant 3 with third motif having DD or ED/haloacid dehalogenase superfamily, subfamily IA, variant 1 with third motif having Dx(3-4)D or Dx(3-4)E [Anaerocolumna xylanovorans DSM 12503]|uniref:Haloacid dehalogenase superfamily, subfamily IA, variant 3 with third motif having DD or ED/haloacid dehalogenase superfamily, subfamily IA, variant 1 with third motif having Dx(3-4)D or Dx(3-4)E n=2 Tax=Anaerocolumna TaxID=1843210 RepID=A0A1M7XXY0_9FIRM|nr:haloacid dehalogenase superfamily, subfamily IA, variant 3 with third motif having DD or ED/haloacid dehalogenase superfamily, subfamily IA, variant 1 with third motif having Dx(3-4)D or Dx(3-4)E [Anaerocolumna xylanovorans DSM 12503]
MKGMVLKMDKKYILFDFDGVIVNTEESNAKYLRQALACFGILLTDEERSSLMGKNDPSILAGLLSKSSKQVTLEEFMNKRREIGNTYENSCIEPMPGLVSFIKECRRKGIKTGIVTSTSTRLIITALNRMNMMSLFDVIICGDMCTKSKPDPQGYLKAMDILGAGPEECIVLEDSPAGIRAAKSAGAFVAAYCGSGIKQDISEADISVDSFRECNEKIKNLIL